MSLTLNMVGGGGGGGISATDALLRVQAPIGSTISITKGAVTKTDAGHENADDSRFYDYYFIIHASQFDSITPWTVTMVNGSMTQTDTVIIDSADEYNVLFKYLLLYDSGNEFTDLTGGWSFNDNGVGTNSLTKNAEDMVLYSSTGSTSANACTFTANAIDTSSFTTIKILYDFAYTGTKDSDTGNFALRTTVPTSGGWSGNYNYQADLSSGSEKTTSCSISTATNPLYVAVRVWTNNGFATTVTITIKRVWLE